MRTKRRYELKRRAEQQEETRRRIVAAAVELHTTIGPARTTIRSVAERAGVARPTVYLHFPDEESLFRACSGKWWADHPLPDPAPWRGIDDPESVLRTALSELYAYYGENESLLSNVGRDVDLVPVLRKVGDFSPYLDEVRELLARGWGARGRARRRVAGALGHALEFTTWQSLVRRQALSEEEAIEIMVGSVRQAVEGRGAREAREGA